MIYAQKNTIQSFIIHYVNSLVASCWALVFLRLPSPQNHPVPFSTFFHMHIHSFEKKKSQNCSVFFVFLKKRITLKLNLMSKRITCLANVCRCRHECTGPLSTCRHHRGAHPQKKKIVLHYLSVPVLVSLTTCFYRWASPPQNQTAPLSSWKHMRRCQTPTTSSWLLHSFSPSLSLCSFGFPHFHSCFFTN